MNEFQPLIDELYRERILRARQMTPEEKFRAGPELFEAACEITLSGIAAQHPDTTPEQRLQILRERLALRARLEWLEAPVIE